MYFTILHWITIAIFIVLFILLVFLSLKEKKKNVLLSMIFASFLVTSTMALFSMFVLDKYTKEAQLYNVSHKRILRNESMHVTGKVKNVGKFKIGICTLEVKLVNEAIHSGNVKGNSIFTPTSSFSQLFGDSDGVKSSTILHEFTIAEDLEPREMRHFTVSFKYPPHFSKPVLRNKLFCH